MENDFADSRLLAFEEEIADIDFSVLPHGPTKPVFPDYIRVLLFLDFDGVLHGERFSANEFEFLPDFERAMEPFREVAVILSTSWRIDTPFDRLRERFSETFRERIIGCTPNRLDGLSDGGRELEIREFIRINELDGCDWLAVDDMRFLFLSDENLFLVDGYFGLTDIDIRRLTARLSKMLAKA